MGLVVYAVGGDFRKHEKMLAAQTSFWCRLWLMRRGAMFMVSSVVIVNVALGQTTWLGRSHAFQETLHSAGTLVTMGQGLFN